MYCTSGHLCNYPKYFKDAKQLKPSIYYQFNRISLNYNQQSETLVLATILVCSLKLAKMIRKLKKSYNVERKDSL